ncbi:hypothetical protein WJX81_000180 [Elliptochloris bilobata]|uniref:JmjC domain-containing protein n=1 Tax=Elliptochloris bilobata TaxID=381761 RepID=A0AAW1RYK5_9CHLO
MVSGRKLFVLYPPSDAASLYPLPAPEATQSAVDPLDADTIGGLPLYAMARPHVTVLGPGEALLVPAGWWHYAAALDPSITVMRNFYHRATNAAGLVELVLSAVNGLSSPAAA